ncbi:MAG: DnaB-like helicase N-terminal domain-containing protein, partial [Deltaproteobacteria bacterium]|nr:DnaB-like helicase N-terminal domain-containing protein [Deltaproteobacteria bacterium]
MARKTSETITPPVRVPPQNIEAEQWVLGGILIENGALFRVLEVILGEEFYREAHRKIFAAMLGLYEKNEPQDIITVSDFLRNRNELEDVGGMSYLATLADAVPTAANIVHYAKIIREKFILRSLIQKTSEISYRCYEKHDDVDNILDEAEQAIFE